MIGRVPAYVLMAFVAYSPGGCSPREGVRPDPFVVLEPPFGISSTLTVTTDPSGADVWIGPGSASTDSSDAGSDPARYLGRTPVTKVITVEDLSPDGSLQYSIRSGNLRRDGRIERAQQTLHNGGSFRIQADFRKGWKLGWKSERLEKDFRRSVVHGPPEKGEFSVRTWEILSLHCVRSPGKWEEAGQSSTGKVEGPAGVAADLWVRPLTSRRASREPPGN